jgi:hypothetical protein
MNDQVLSVQGVLTFLKMVEFIPSFEAEFFDYDSFMLLDRDTIQEIQQPTGGKLPMGVRLKINKFITTHRGGPVPNLAALSPIKDVQVGVVSVTTPFTHLTTKK